MKRDMEQAGKEGHKDSQAQLNDYYNKLVEGLASGEPSYFFNGDRTHNTTIMRFMLDNSSVINMYCGKMSVFRKGFYDEIKNAQNEQNGLSEYLKRQLKESFNSFMQGQDKKMTVIFESFDEKYLEDLIFDRSVFMEYVSKGKISLFVLDDEFSYKKELDHFTYTDKEIVRIENDREQHSAICTIKDPGYENIRHRFSALKMIAKPIELSF